MNTRLNIAAGKSYKNGWGTTVNIVSAPTPECRWHSDEFGNYYHPNGEMAVISGSAKSNLASEVQSDVGPCDCQKTVDEQLASSNARIAFGLLFGNATIDRSPAMIVLEKIDEKKRGKFPTLLATCCPFCGERYRKDSALSLKSPEGAP